MWARVIGPEPPDEFTMNHWESEGWSDIRVLGPCPTVDRTSGKPGAMVFVVYLHRSLVLTGAAQKKPGWPIRRREAPQPVTDSGDGDAGGGALN